MSCFKRLGDLRFYIILTLLHSRSSPLEQRYIVACFPHHWVGQLDRRHFTRWHFSRQQNVCRGKQEIRKRLKVGDGDFWQERFETGVKNVGKFFVEFRKRRKRRKRGRRKRSSRRQCRRPKRIRSLHFDVHRIQRSAGTKEITLLVIERIKISGLQ